MRLECNHKMGGGGQWMSKRTLTERERFRWTLSWCTEPFAVCKSRINEPYYEVGLITGRSRTYLPSGLGEIYLSATRDEPENFQRFATFRYQYESWIPENCAELKTKTSAEYIGLYENTLFWDRFPVNVITLHLNISLVTKDRGITRRRHSRWFLLLYERIRIDLHDHFRNVVKKKCVWRI